MTEKKLQPLQFAAIFIFVLTLAGCRSHMVTINLINTGNQPISTIIVDYPNATFGKDRLAPGKAFSSTVKLIDDGAIKVQFTDVRGGRHTYSGPVLHKNAEGWIEVKLDQDSVVVDTKGVAH